MAEQVLVRQASGRAGAPAGEGPMCDARGLRGLVDGGAKCFVGGTADQDQRVTVLANATPLPDAPLVRKPSRLAPEAQ